MLTIRCRYFYVQYAWFLLNINVFRNFDWQIKQVDQRKFSDAKDGDTFTITLVQVRERVPTQRRLRNAGKKVIKNKKNTPWYSVDLGVGVIVKNGSKLYAERTDSTAARIALSLIGQVFDKTSFNHSISLHQTKEIKRFRVNILVDHRGRVQSPSQYAFWINAEDVVFLHARTECEENFHVKNSLPLKILKSIDGCKSGTPVLVDKYNYKNDEYIVFLRNLVINMQSVSKQDIDNFSFEFIESDNGNNNTTTRNLAFSANDSNVAYNAEESEFFNLESITTTKNGKEKVIQIDELRQHVANPTMSERFFSMFSIFAKRQENLNDPKVVDARLTTAIIKKLKGLVGKGHMDVKLHFALTSLPSDQEDIVRLFPKESCTSVSIKTRNLMPWGRESWPQNYMHVDSSENFGKITKPFLDLTADVNRIREEMEVRNLEDPNKTFVVLEVLQRQFLGDIQRWFKLEEKSLYEKKQEEQKTAERKKRIELRGQNELAFQERRKQSKEKRDKRNRDVITIQSLARRLNAKHKGHGQDNKQLSSSTTTTTTTKLELDFLTQEFYDSAAQTSHQYYTPQMDELGTLDLVYTFFKSFNKQLKTTNLDFQGAVVRFIHNLVVFKNALLLMKHHVKTIINNHEHRDRFLKLVDLGSIHRLQQHLTGATKFTASTPETLARGDFDIFYTDVKNPAPKHIDSVQWKDIQQTLTNFEKKSKVDVVKLMEEEVQGETSFVQSSIVNWLFGYSDTTLPVLERQPSHQTIQGKRAGLPNGRFFKLDNTCWLNSILQSLITACGDQLLQNLNEVEKDLQIMDVSEMEIDDETKATIRQRNRHKNFVSSLHNLLRYYAANDTTRKRKRDEEEILAILKQAVKDSFELASPFLREVELDGMIVQREERNCQQDASEGFNKIIAMCDQLGLKQIVGIMSGEETVTMSCDQPSCGWSSSSTIPFINLPIPIMIDENNINRIFTLQNCVDGYVNPALMEEHKCSGSDHFGLSEGHTSKTSLFTQTPEVLVFTLGRFSFGQRATKNTTPVKKLTDILTVKRYTYEGESKVQKEDFYELAAVIVHNGNSANSGHYVAYTRNVGYGKWLLYDDNKSVKEFSELPKEVEKLGYMFFFRKLTRHEDSPPAQPLALPPPATTTTSTTTQQKNSTTRTTAQSSSESSSSSSSMIQTDVTTSQESTSDEDAIFCRDNTYSGEVLLQQETNIKYVLSPNVVVTNEILDWYYRYGSTLHFQQVLEKYGKNTNMYHIPQDDKDNKNVHFVQHLMMKTITSKDQFAITKMETMLKQGYAYLLRENMINVVFHDCVRNVGNADANLRILKLLWHYGATLVYSSHTWDKPALDNFLVEEVAPAWNQDFNAVSSDEREVNTHQEPSWWRKIFCFDWLGRKSKRKPTFF